MSIFFNSKSDSRFIKLALIIILLLSLSAGIFSVFYYGDAFLLGSLERFNNDDVKYIRSAWTLLDKGIFTYNYVDQPTVFIMPGLTLVLAFFMLLFGKFSGIVAFKIFQVLLQTLCLYLIFLIGKKVFNSRIAIIACIFNLLYVVNSLSSQLILTETLFTFLLLLLIYISLWAVERKSLKLYMFGAVIWIGAIYLRPTIGLYPLLILFLWLKEKYSWQEMLKYTAVVLGMFFLLMAPWWIRNYVTFDRFIPLTLSSGNPFLQGTYIDYDQKKGHIPYKAQTTEIATNELETQIGWQRLNTYVPQEPWHYLYWYTIGKSIMLWKKPFYWHAIFNVPYPDMLFMHRVILALGTLGLILYVFYFRKKQKQPNLQVNFMGNSNHSSSHHYYPFFLFLVILYFNLIYLPYYTFARYAYPVMPLVILFASVPLYLLVKKLSESWQSKVK